MDNNEIWIPQAQRLKPFNGNLLPATIGENKTKKFLIKKGSKLKDQNFCVDDCSINREGTFIQCHHGKTNHPPSLKLGETIRLSGIDWAFCGSGTNAIGGFSKFKVHTTTPDPWDIIHGARK